MAQSSEDRLKKIIADQLSVNEDDVVPEASFIDDLNADSLDLVELIMSLEEEFGVQMEDDDLIPENFETIESLSSYVVSKRKG